MDEQTSDESNVLERELISLLHQVEDWLEKPMIALAFIWLALTIAELIWGLDPAFGLVVTGIWIVFILDFLLRFTLAPHKWMYVKRNWLTALSLVLPALRLFRIGQALRLFRATRGLRLVRAVSSVNRGVNALRATLGRRGFGYVMGFTAIVTLTGAAGMLAFEGDAAGGGLDSYWEAVWWTAMMLTTIGSEYWPVTAEGRLISLLLSIYSLGILGYVTASLASFFVGRDAENDSAELAGADAVEALRAEIRLLHAELLKRSGER